MSYTRNQCRHGRKEGALSSENAWLDELVSRAIIETNTSDHTFPEALRRDLTELLSDTLQTSQKQAELENVAARLGLINRGEQ